MTSVSHVRKVSGPESPRLRLRLRPKAPATGPVDGAWWPRSRDLPAELPELLSVLAVRLGRVQRVSYNLAEWDAAPGRITVDGERTRLGGFRSQPVHTVAMTAMNGQRLTLLVVPSDADGAEAHQTMMNASRRDNTDTTDDLLSAGDARPLNESGRVALERWEIDGGRIPVQMAKDTR